MLPAVNLVVAAAAAASVLAMAAPPAAPRDKGSTAHAIGYSTGEITRIDADRGTVTLKHGPIHDLGMPDMTTRGAREALAPFGFSYFTAVST